MRRFVSMIAVFALLLICPGMGGIGQVLAAGNGSNPAQAAADHTPCHGTETAGQHDGTASETDAPPHKSDAPCGDMSACGAHHWLQSPSATVPVLLSGTVERSLPPSRAMVSAIPAPDPYPPKHASIA